MGAGRYAHEPNPALQQLGKCEVLRPGRIPEAYLLGVPGLAGDESRNSGLGTKSFWPLALPACTTSLTLFSS